MTIGSYGFESYNPYEGRFPGLRVVSRETLELMKMLRLAGYEVTVSPEDGSKLHYYTRKGLHELMADPVIAFVIGTYTSLLINLLSNLVYDWVKGEEHDVPNIVVEFNEQGNKLRYNHKGLVVNDNEFIELVSKLFQRKEEYSKSLSIKSPQEDLLIPVYLEHSSKIVGWAQKIVKDDIGLRLDRLEIVDPDTWNKIETGELKGMSIAGIVTKSTCSICHSEYVYCNHSTRKTYNGQICSVRIDSFLIGEASIVSNPAQPLTKIKIIRATS